MPATRRRSTTRAAERLKARAKRKKKKASKETLRQFGKRTPTKVPASSGRAVGRKEKPIPAGSRPTGKSRKPKWTKGLEKIDVPTTALTKADKEKLTGTRTKGACRCPHCGKVAAFISEKWWLRSKTVRVRRKVCRACRKNHVSYEIFESLFLRVTKKNRNRRKETAA